MPGRSEHRRNLLAVGLLAALLALVATIQVRSQAAVQRSLEGQDNTSLAFLIDDLHTANDSLGAQADALTGQRDALRAGSGTAAREALAAEDQRLKVALGLIPVHGPGVVITIDAPLTAFDLEDAMNNLRQAGAEAISVNDHRVISGTVFRTAAGGVSLDGMSTRPPYVLSAIGDPARLATLGQEMTRSLRADERVRTATFRSDPEVRILATTGPRPFVYGTSS